MVRAEKVPAALPVSLHGVDQKAGSNGMCVPHRFRAADTGSFGVALAGYGSDVQIAVKT
jgi:hypothetical protein